ncbi:NAD-dependent protein deacetylase sirtuin-2 [Camelus dromedarius]|uniref:NAD-dependent protein deacetylase sirtuin-2 n=1 Tax=Camelus dromedarius TaxID=9838 RepID=A0A5N4DQI5_CAMDR|nr:NAD-dependent protein deacetylase sirtuin-2 [Camelus dromedarius]KAB1273365.1 NAD-dependent protein deacetylase sirtuin-2 [Camelus dromedarius]KAB1273367.1 NAD-dependent protein deacetylase sirtuin-2 [Camelus dromedarius]KAB1273369.1 NAD-dependent protein deacetylase sirtuin-2 [Camelus dromedarius]KAB1273371.1 NAD-dependent protein deacetylase sirtuin-2 [Camelus dromedarius]
MAAGSCSSPPYLGPLLFPVPSRDRAVGDSPEGPRPAPMAEPDPSDPVETQAGKVQEAQDSDSDTEGGAAGGEEAEMDFLRNFFSQTLGLGTQKERLLDELTLEGVARYMQSERCRRVICLVGAGISTSAGIPDFRSPTTGLYANLEKYHLPYPEAIFEISYFKKHPEPFFTLAKELYPGQFKPTICHYFIRLLKEKGLLLRCYTQNIDTLERVAGLEPEDLVEAHGTFYTSHCISPVCRQEYMLSWMKEKIFSEVTPKCEKCQSVVKPDIVFFGENLPARFFSCMQSDFLKVDLLIIMGTSLQVQPFASLIGKAPLSTPRLLINKEKTGQKAYRDVAWLGDCDQGCLALADLLGWKKELEDLVRKEHASIDAQSGLGTPNPTTSASPKKSPPPAKDEARTKEGEKPQ